MKKNNRLTLAAADLSECMINPPKLSVAYNANIEVKFSKHTVNRACGEHISKILSKAVANQAHSHTIPLIDKNRMRITQSLIPSKLFVS